ncbi:MAG: hypothetical protein IJK87_08370 [Prevotella sp.]|nr:hypothetical protein [Prevotella sp.]
MEPFIVGVDITDVTNLYGRKRQIETLVSCAKRRENAGIIGARRFGKTCLLKAMEFHINSNKEYNAYPVYFDVKTQTGIKKNTADVYRYLAALLASKMCTDGLLPEGVFKISRRCKLYVSNDMLDMLIQMKEWNTEYQKEAIFFLADKVAETGKYVLLLLDEIDYLLLEALESPADFARIRGAATDKSCKMKFWIAGTTTWSAICTDVGSPELNCGLQNVTLYPLEIEESTNMWNNECMLIEDSHLRKLLMNIGDTVIDKTGGVPYFEKYVGSCFLNKNVVSMPDYTIIRDYLSEIVNSRFMSESERNVLAVLCDGPKQFEVIPDGVNALMSKGLLSKVGDGYKITMGYLKDYLIAYRNNKELETPDDTVQKEIDVLVEQIGRLRNNVNKSYHPDLIPFSASTEDVSEFETLKIICYNEPTMDAFSGALYKLYYEGSNKGNSLPEGFLVRDFSNMVRALRQMYNHRECEPTSMTEGQLLLLINHGMHPIEQEHFSNMQKEMLKAYISELSEMISLRESKGLALVAGKEYEGVVVETTEGYKNIHCNLAKWPLQMRKTNYTNFSNGDKVFFTAGYEQYDETKPKKWIAYNIRKK